MDSAKKTKRLAAVSRVRKRNSTSYKPASHNGVQGRASLLKNNKILAVSLQETRCELSNYKTFFEESLECISKVKIAKSKMIQLSTTLKDFVNAFDETLLSMEFDEPKWKSLKFSPQCSKIFENEMNPVLEVADEVLHHNGSFEEENNTNSECSTDHPVEVAQSILHRENDDDLKKISFKSSQKETESDSCDLNNVALSLDSEIGKAKGNVGMKTKLPNLSSQTVKTTKIPRCKTLPVNLTSQKESELRNKACKRKSPEKKGEVLESDFSRRKTFVVKSSNVLKNSELKGNLLEKDVDTENLVNVNEDALILKNKRKTFVKKSSLKDSVLAANLNDLQDMDSEINVNIGTVIQGDELIIKNDKRKTFVKKSSVKDSVLAGNLNDIQDMDSEININKGMVIQGDELIVKIDERKAFVKESSSKDSVLAANVNDIQDMDSEINVNKGTAIQGDELIIKNAERKTFIKKSTLKDSVLAANLNDIQDMDSEINVNKGTVIQRDELIIKNNKRKTFVKKSSHKTVPNQNNDYQTTFPNKECISVDSKLATIETKNFENNEESEENLRPFSYLQSHMPQSETDDVFCENRGEIEPTVLSLNINVASVTPSEERNGEDEILIAHKPSSFEKIKEQNVMKNVSSEEHTSQEMNENNKMPIVNEPSSSENQTKEHLIKRTTFRDCLKLSDSDCEEIPFGLRPSSRWKNYKAFLESSDSECEEISVVESFNEKRRPVEATPIRRQITNNKKKKFVFDGKKRKSILKKESVSKIMRSESYINNHKIEDTNAVVHVELDEMINNKGHSDNTESDAVNVSKIHSKVKKTRDIHHPSVESTYAKKKVDKSCKIKNSKKYSSKNVALDSVPLKTEKRNKKKNVYDDLNILKFSEEEAFTVDTVTQGDGTEKETELGFPCKKTGENTYLVQAEIHPPPPSLNTVDDIKEVNKENEMLNLQNMQVAVVLEDVFKSNNIDISNFYVKNSLCKKTVSHKVPLSANTSNITVEADASIEKFRCDEVFETGNADLHNDMLLDVGDFDIQDNALLHSEIPRPRRRKEVNYKEPSLHRKMRRC